MKLVDLIKGLPITLEPGSAAIEVTDIVEDSRRAARGCLFIARSGAKVDGRMYIADAVRAGAVAVLSDDGDSIAPSVAALKTHDVALGAALLAERFHHHPTRELDLIGVTGTNGKTTTTYLIRHLLNRAGVKCGLVGTVQIDDGAAEVDANLTTPPALELSGLMRAMVKHGCRACVMEASSHALHQKRTAGLEFKIGVFTNLTGDHLDYHQTMEAYRAAKAILFQSLPNDGFAIVNHDDPASAAIIHDCAAKVVTCGIEQRDAACTAVIERSTLNGIDVTFAGPWGSFDCRLPLIGKHNVANALQALAACHALGLDRQALLDGISSCSAPPGRLEPVTTPEHEFAILVDYAHTDDALANVLRALKPSVPAGGKLRVVFGCGGDRDRTKRPRMAKVVCEYADDVIITSDNPRTEDPAAIIEEICTGVPAARLAGTMRIVDRAEAIHAAIHRLQPGDILLIAGKGHEDYQIIGTTKRPFDDRKVAAAALAARSLPKHSAAKSSRRPSAAAR